MPCWDPPPALPQGAPLPSVVVVSLLLVLGEACGYVGRVMGYPVHTYVHTHVLYVVRRSQSKLISQCILAQLTGRCHLVVNIRMSQTFSMYVPSMGLIVLYQLDCYSNRTTHIEDLLCSNFTLRFDKGRCPSLAKFSVSRLSCIECKIEQFISIYNFRAFSNACKTCND